MTALGRPAFAAPPIDTLTEAEARARAALVSDVSYDVTLSFAARAVSYAGEALVRFRLTRPPQQDLRLDFKSSGLRRMSIDGVELPPTAHDGVKVSLPARLLRQGANSVSLEYRNDYDASGSGVFHLTDPVDSREYVYTDFEPFNAHRLLPCFDQPDLKAVLRLRLIVPPGWVALANSAEAESHAAPEPPLSKAVAHRDDSDGAPYSLQSTAYSLRAGDARAVVHDFRPTPPLSTYLFFVGVGQYAAFSDERARVPSRLFARQSMRRYVDAAELHRLTRRGMAVYEHYFGIPYPFDKFDQIFVPDFSPGGMENAGAVTYHERYLFRHAPTAGERSERAELMLHELAHMWFGDLVTMRWWDGLWLNESFATYVGNLALARATEFRDAFEEFLTVQKSGAYRQDQMPTTHPVAGQVPDTLTAFSNFDDITYAKGASLLKQLAFFLGPDTFRRGVIRYFREHSWGSTETADFLGALGQTAGRDLTAWSRQHLETSGVNELAPRLELANGKLQSLWLELRPGNAGALLPHALEVAVYTADAAGQLTLGKTARVLVEAEHTRVAGLEGQPAPAFVWANHGDHAYLKVMLDEASLAFARAHLDKIPDSMTRRGVWLTLWEMVRAGQLAPREYLETVRLHAPREPNPKVLQDIFQSAVTAVERYVANGREALQAALHETAWTGLLGAAAGSDAQKVWFGLAIDTAADAPALAHLESLLDGKLALPALELDDERRWDLVVRLCAFARPGARRRLAAQSRRDATDLGKQQALAAEASFPEPAAKEAAWKRFTADTTSSLDSLRPAMQHFHWAHQQELSRPFVTRYFDAVIPIRNGRDQEFAARLVEDLFPATLADETVTRQAHAFLKSHPELPADIRNPLLQETDELELALRLRAR